MCDGVEAVMGEGGERRVGRMRRRVEAVEAMEARVGRDGEMVGDGGEGGEILTGPVGSVRLGMIAFSIDTLDILSVDTA